MKKVSIIVIIILCLITTVYTRSNNKCENKDVLLSQSANSSSGLYWTYELNTEDIISEKNIMKANFH